MLTQLQALATEKSSDKRRELLKRTADLFFQQASDLRGESDMELFAQVVSILLGSVAETDRAEFADEYGAQTELPTRVVARLADDTIAVAAPIIRNSPVLTETDLVLLARNKTMPFRVAIAERSHISTIVTDTLIGFEEPEVMLALAENHTAVISAPGYRHLADLAASNCKLVDQLGARPDLPLEVARRLLAYMSPEAAAKLTRLLAADGASVKNLVQRAIPKVADAHLERANRRLQIRAEARVHADLVVRDIWLNDIAKSGSVSDVSLAMSELAGIAEQQASNAIVSIEGDALTVLCKAIELRFDTYVMLDRLRCTRVRLPSRSRQLLQTIYDELTVEAAKRAMSFVKLRSSVVGK